MAHWRSISPGKLILCNSNCGFDILSCIEELSDVFKNKEKEEYLSIVKPLIQFICENDEEHAIISNHIATGVATIELWNKLNGTSLTREKELLKIILNHQSEEGWYKEYEGADQGYQTLCTCI